MTYDTLRHFADSWGLLFLFVVFLFVLIRALHPDAHAHHDEAAGIPFRDEEPRS